MDRKARRVAMRNIIVDPDFYFCTAFNLDLQKRSTGVESTELDAVYWESMQMFALMVSSLLPSYDIICTITNGSGKHKRQPTPPNFVLELEKL